MRSASVVSTALVTALLGVGWAQFAQAEVQAAHSTLSSFVVGQPFDLRENFQGFGSKFSSRVDLEAGYQFDVPPPWGVEGAFLFSPGQTESLTENFRSVDVKAYYYTANVLYNFLPKSSVLPFLAAGFGAVSLDVNGSKTETFPTFSYGGGLRYDMSKWATLRLDARDYIYRTDQLSSALQLVFGLPPDFDRTINDLSLNVGISLKF